MIDDRSLSVRLAKYSVLKPFEIINTVAFAVIDPGRSAEG
jgi:hypothetical protein